MQSCLWTKVCGLRTFLSGPPTLSEEYCGLLEITPESELESHKERNWQNILILKISPQFLGI